MSKKVDLRGLPEVCCGSLRVGLVDLTDQMAVPAATAAAAETPSIGYGWVAPVPFRKRGGEVGRQSDGQASAHLMKRPGPMDLSRQAGISHIAVHDDADSMPGHAEIRQMQAVVRAEPYVCHEEVE